MNALTGLIGQVPAPAAYAILAAAVLAESVLLIGTFIPTLTLLLASGALARAGDLNLLLVIATASCAVVAGDALGHRTGHLLGSRLRTGRLGRRIPTAAWQRAETLMARRGGQAVFLSRFFPVVRTLAPHLAGATRLPYRRIAPYSLLAAPLWAGAEAATGYAAATSLQHVITLAGPALAATVVLVAGAVLAVTKVRRRQAAAGAGGRCGRTGPSPGAAAESVPPARSTWSDSPASARPPGPGPPPACAGCTAAARPARRDQPRSQPRTVVACLPSRSAIRRKPNPAAASSRPTPTSSTRRQPA